MLRGTSDANLRFSELCLLLSHLGFVERIKGGHHIFIRLDVSEILNLATPRFFRKTLPGKAGSQRDRKIQIGEGGRVKYEVILYWSDEDLLFIADVPELPGCAADGSTRQEALTNAEVVIREWIETAQELGRPIPEPKGRLLYA